MTYSTAAKAAEAFALFTAERDVIAARLEASKRYRGRANDKREHQAYCDLCAAAMREYTELVEAERREADDIEQAFRARVAERAYFMALNGEGCNDHDRWVQSERIERVLVAVEACDWTEAVRVAQECYPRNPALH